MIGYGLLGRVQSGTRHRCHLFRYVSKVIESECPAVLHLTSSPPTCLPPPHPHPPRHLLDPPHHCTSQSPPPRHLANPFPVPSSPPRPHKQEHHARRTASSCTDRRTDGQTNRQTGTPGCFCAMCVFHVVQAEVHNLVAPAPDGAQAQAPPQPRSLHHLHSLHSNLALLLNMICGGSQSGNMLPAMPRGRPVLLCAQRVEC